MTLLFFLKPHRFSGGSRTVNMARAVEKALKKSPDQKWQDAVSFSKRFIKAPEKSLKLVQKAQAKVAEIKALPKVRTEDSGYLAAVYEALTDIRQLLLETQAKEQADLRAQQAQAAIYAVMLNVALSKLREDLLIEMEDEELLLTLLIGD